jgi:hypothetical protein
MGNEIKIEKRDWDRDRRQESRSRLTIKIGIGMKGRNQGRILLKFSERMYLKTTE